MFVILITIAAGLSAQAVKRDPFHLKLAAPISTWDEAIPLGNGLTGGLLWGEGSRIKLSLDRGDLWDLRTPEMLERPDWNYATIKRLVASKDQKTLVKMFDEPYDNIPYPTKIPCARLELELPAGVTADSFDLDLKNALGSVTAGDKKIEVFFSAAEPVTMIRASGVDANYKIIRPASLEKLEYSKAVFREGSGLSWMIQEGALGLKYAVVAGKKTEGETSVIAVSITSSKDGADPLELGKQRVQNALRKGYRSMLQQHELWWSKFWATSSVAIPNDGLNFHYNLVKYFYGAASRKGAPPMPLQGVWTADSDKLPPWKGDYHNDLNTQTTYIAYQTAGLFESGNSFIDFNWKLLPAYREFARKFFGTNGAAVPGVMRLDGKPMGGWGQYSLSPTQGLWIGHLFYLHWRYTMDRRFLAEKAYPWYSEIAENVVGLLKEDENGRLKLPLSTSPEIFDNSLKAWLPPNSNYDLALLKTSFGVLTEMADELGKKAEAEKWRSLRTRLDDLDIDADGALTFAQGYPYNESHRHFSHLLAVYPLDLLTIEGTERERHIVNASVNRLDKLGTSWWTGYSFAWMSCLAARTGNADLALKYLKDYERAFILRNGFHANGDQTKSGLSKFTYRPFTLEGNFLAMQAMQEMLLQSWGNTVRIFPAVPDEWKSASFAYLRAMGGFIVSARREGGRIVWIRIRATSDQRLKLKIHNAGDLKWTRKVELIKDGSIETFLKNGSVLIGEYK